MIAAILDAADRLGFGDKMRAAEANIDLALTARALIADTQARHPGAADQLHHAIELLKIPGRRRAVPAVIAAHWRELIERVAIGADTRPGTAVEVCLAMSEVSLTTPLNAEGFALYARMWLTAGLPDVAGLAASDDHNEYLYGSTVDEAEAQARKRLTQRDRHLNGATCNGLHFDEPVECRYSTAAPAAA